MRFQQSNARFATFIANFPPIRPRNPIMAGREKRPPDCDSGDTHYGTAVIQEPLEDHPPLQRPRLPGGCGRRGRLGLLLLAAPGPPTPTPAHIPRSPAP